MAEGSIFWLIGSVTGRGETVETFFMSVVYIIITWKKRRCTGNTTNSWLDHTNLHYVLFSLNWLMQAAFFRQFMMLLFCGKVVSVEPGLFKKE